MKVAYLTSRYPSLSHTFIAREVAALRRRGLEIDTFSVRRTDPALVLSQADRDAHATTEALLPPTPGALAAAAVAAAIRPRHTAHLLRSALLRRGRGPKRTLWQLFYAVEAVLLWRRCRRAATSHVHAHFANVGADVARLAAVFGGDGWTWSFTMHGPTEFADVSGFDLAGKVEDAAFVICISDFCRSQLMALVDPVHWAKLLVVHCGIDLSQFEPVERAPRRGAPLRVLCVGRLVPEKGQSVLLDALARLRDAGTAVEVTLVADGPCRAALERQADELGVAGAVTFTGNVGQDEIADRYREADVFCLPSFAEGVPTVLMEAMATGLPVVSTSIAGIPELVTDGESGLLVAPGRADLLADALRMLAHDPDRRSAMGRAGRATVQKEFDVDGTSAALASIFRDALSRS